MCYLKNELSLSSVSSAAMHVLRAEWDRASRDNLLILKKQLPLKTIIIIIIIKNDNRRTLAYDLIDSDTLGSWPMAHRKIFQTTSKDQRSSQGWRHTGSSRYVYYHGLVQKLIVLERGPARGPWFRTPCQY